ncbi:unnamed protein product [Paramecium pentaurelia]|uniref:Uncharacterized protein n=1 Tax=Paramecium pentaurelia TaxID=43138 RepID=A0A8S1XA51_9CILI|nr:unnamed protein product [Paramecium pentaurelia]
MEQGVFLWKMQLFVILGNQIYYSPSSQLRYISRFSQLDFHLQQQIINMVNKQLVLIVQINILIIIEIMICPINKQLNKQVQRNINQNHHQLIIIKYSSTIIYQQLYKRFEIYYTFYKNEGYLEQFDDIRPICQEGWILDEFLENCNLFCGDGIIQEQCNDSNLRFSYLVIYANIQHGYDKCELNQISALQFWMGTKRQQMLFFFGDGLIDLHSIEQCDSSYIFNNETTKCEKIKSLDYENNDINNTTDDFDITFHYVCSNNFILKRSVNQCENSLLNSKNEQFDEGNFNEEDGCSDYYIEEDFYQCQNDENSMHLFLYSIS